MSAQQVERVAAQSYADVPSTYDIAMILSGKADKPVESALPAVAAERALGAGISNHDELLDHQREVIQYASFHLKPASMAELAANVAARHVELTHNPDLDLEGEMGGYVLLGSRVCGKGNSFPVDLEVTFDGADVNQKFSSNASAGTHVTIPANCPPVKCDQQLFERYAFTPNENSLIKACWDNVRLHELDDHVVTLPSGLKRVQLDSPLALAALALRPNEYGCGTVDDVAHKITKYRDEKDNNEYALLAPEVCDKAYALVETYRKALPFHRSDEMGATFDRIGAEFNDADGVVAVGSAQAAHQHANICAQPYTAHVDVELRYGVWNRTRPMADNSC